MDRARLTLLPSGRAHSELQDIVLVIASLPVEELGLGELKVEVTKCYWVTRAALNAESVLPGPSSRTNSILYYYPVFSCSL